MKKIFYEKVGRRYKPVYVYDPDLMNALPQGDHLVSVYPGGQSTRYNIDPNYAVLIAASRVAKDAMQTVIRQAGEARPQRTELTPAQQQAWQAMQAALGEDRFYLSYGATADVVDAGIKVLHKEATELMTHPAVQDAYDQFMMVCKMVRQTP